MSRGQCYLAKHKAPLLTRMSDENPKLDLTTGSPQETAENSSAHTILCFIGPRVCVCERDVPSCVCVDKSSVKCINVVMSVTFWRLSAEVTAVMASSDQSRPLQLHILTRPQTGNPLCWWGQGTSRTKPSFWGKSWPLRSTSTGTMLDMNIFITHILQA